MSENIGSTENRHKRGGIDSKRRKIANAKRRGGAAWRRKHGNAAGAAASVEQWRGGEGSSKRGEKKQTNGTQRLGGVNGSGGSAAKWAARVASAAGISRGALVARAGGLLDAEATTRRARTSATLRFSTRSGKTARRRVRASRRAASLKIIFAALRRAGVAAWLRRHASAASRAAQRYRALLRAPIAYFCVKILFDAHHARGSWHINVRIAARSAHGIESALGGQARPVGRVIFAAPRASVCAKSNSGAASAGSIAGGISSSVLAQNMARGANDKSRRARASTSAARAAASAATSSRASAPTAYSLLARSFAPFDAWRRLSSAAGHSAWRTAAAGGIKRASPRRRCIKHRHQSMPAASGMTMARRMARHRRRASRRRHRGEWRGENRRAARQQIMAAKRWQHSARRRAKTSARRGA